MFKRHPIVTVVVAACFLYMLATAPMVVIDSLGALGGLLGKWLDGVVMALGELV